MPSEAIDRIVADFRAIEAGLPGRSAAWLDHARRDAEERSNTLRRGLGAPIDGEQRIGASKAKALSGVNDIAADTAGAIVAKLLGKEISRDEVQRALAPRAAE